MVQLETKRKPQKDVLAFIAGAMKQNDEDCASCFYTIDQQIQKDANYRLPDIKQPASANRQYSIESDPVRRWIQYLQ